MRKLWLRLVSVTAAIVAVCVIASVRMSANTLVSGLVARADCSSYDITFLADFLDNHVAWRVSYNITLTPTTGSPVTVTGVLPLPGPYLDSNNWASTATASPNWGVPLNGTYTFSGTAALLGDNGPF